MAKFNVAFRISRKRIGFREITVDTVSPAIDPQKRETRDEIRRAIAPDYDCSANLVELVTVSPTSEENTSKPWSASATGQDTEVSEMVEGTEVETQNKGGSQGGIPQPSADQINSAERNELELIVLQFPKLAAAAPQFKSLTSDDLRPLVLSHFYPTADVDADDQQTTAPTTSKSKRSK